MSDSQKKFPSDILTGGNSQNFYIQTHNYKTCTAKVEQVFIYFIKYMYCNSYLEPLNELTAP